MTMTEEQLRYAERAARAISFHNDEAGIDNEDDYEIGLFHLLCDVILLCDAKGIDFDAKVSEVREHFASNEA